MNQCTSAYVSIHPSRFRQNSYCGFGSKMPHLLPSAAGFDIVRLFAPETWVQSSPRLRAGQAEWEKGEVPEGRKTCFPRTQVCGGHNLSCPKASEAARSNRQGRWAPRTLSGRCLGKPTLSLPFYNDITTLRHS